MCRLNSGSGRGCRLCAFYEIVCNGKVADGDKEWLVLKTEDGSTQMVSAKLVSRTKPQPQSSSGGNSTTTTQQPSGGSGSSGGGTGGSGGGNGGSGGGQPSGGDPDSVAYSAYMHNIYFLAVHS